MLGVLEGIKDGDVLGLFLLGLEYS